MYTHSSAQHSRSKSIYFFLQSVSFSLTSLMLEDLSFKSERHKNINSTLQIVREVSVLRLILCTETSPNPELIISTFTPPHPSTPAIRLWISLSPQVFSVNDIPAATPPPLPFLLLACLQQSSCRGGMGMVH